MLSQPRAYGREFHGGSLWRGRLWSRLQDQDKTVLGEAGIQHKATYGEFE